MGLNVDLNCDMGEGCANDAALMDYVSSVNIACGFHAGDVDTMRRTVETALEKKVAIGAHPGYRDHENFGRVPKGFCPGEVFDIVTEQIAALNEIVIRAGGRLNHVKAHGALYNQAAKDRWLAGAIAEAISEFNKDLVFYGLSGSLMISEGKTYGLRTASEVFADRTYRADGSLTPRTEPNALITDTDAALTQVLDMLKYGRVRSADGIMVAIKAETVCLHGDGRHALEFARVIYESLTQKKIAIRAL